MSKFSVQLALIFFVVEISFAQQKPHYSQYTQSMSVLNAAATGMFQGLDFRMGLRNQWQGVKDAPKTGYLTFSSPVTFGGDMASYRANDLGVVEPENIDESYDYLSSLSHHAMGVVLLTDKTGPINRVTANFTYAYHLSVGGNANLSTGVGLGVNKLSLNEAALIFEETDDPVVGSANQINQYTPDLNAGIIFYTSNFYIGAAMQQILKNKIKFDGEYNIGKDVAHYFITAGHSFWINQYIAATPSVMIKKVRPLPTAFDLNLRLAYQNQFWLGGGYRKNDAYFANFGFKIQNVVALSYAYDFTTSELRTLTTGSHELSLRILLN